MGTLRSRRIAVAGHRLHRSSRTADFLEYRGCCRAGVAAWHLAWSFQEMPVSDFRSHQSSDVVEGEARKRAKALRKPMIIGNALAKSIGGRCIPSYRPYKMARQALRRVLPIKLEPRAEDDPSLSDHTARCAVRLPEVGPPSPLAYAINGLNHVSCDAHHQPATPAHDRRHTDSRVCAPTAGPGAERIVLEVADIFRLHGPPA